MAQEMVPKEVVDILMQQISALQATVERLTATIEEKDRIIAEKIEIILNQNRARFGQSSEKRAYLLCDGQTSMFEQAGDGITEKDPEKTAGKEKQDVHVTAHTRKAKRTLEELAANLEERIETIDLPEGQKVTADGRPLKCIGVDLVRSELIREPSKAYIRKVYIKTYADPKAEEETGHAELYRPQVPVPLLPHSYLCAFLDHGEIEISNNQVENAIRPIVVGRKNWLFCDTQAGANASATIFTLLETAKANGLNPESYLNHLLDDLPQRFTDEPQAMLDDLMPWSEKSQSNFRV